MAAPVPSSSPAAIEAYKKYQEQLASESPEIKAARQKYNDLGYERNRAEAYWKENPTSANRAKFEKLQGEAQKALEELCQLLKIQVPGGPAPEKETRIAKTPKPHKPAAKKEPKEPELEKRIEETIEEIATESTKVHHFIEKEFPIEEMIRNLDRYEKKAELLQRHSFSIIIRRDYLKLFDEKIIEKLINEIKKAPNGDSIKRDPDIPKFLKGERSHTIKS